MGNFKSETEMINSRIGSVKISEKSSTNNDQILSNGSTVSDLKKHSSSSSDLNSQMLMNPTNLSIPLLKYEENGEIEIQSPDYSMWESIFTDQLDVDFMMSSPVRNTQSSPQASTYFNSAMQAVQSLVGSSPPRFASPLGRGKGLSPLNRVINSPNNQYMQVESLSLPALETLLDDTYDHKDDDFVMFSPMKIPGGGDGSGECYDGLTVGATVPELLDYLTMPNSTRFCESDHQVGPVAAVQPLSQQLQHERQQEEQRQRLHRQPEPPPRMQRPPPPLHHQNMHNTLMVPIPESDQVMIN